jgi:phosphoglycerate kinase
MLEKMTVRELSDVQVRGQRALIRVDYNVPLDENGEVGDDARIRATLPTLEYLRGREARLVLMAHLGRPKGSPDPKYSLAPVAEHLSMLLGDDVGFISSLVSEEAFDASERLESGQVMLLENTRFEPGETKNDEALSKKLAKLGDFYVNDAFGAAHRAHASTEGVTHFLQPAVAGLLMERELEHLGSLLEKPEKPFVAVLGGAKVSGKIDLIENLIGRLDHLCIGGAMACTFFRAMGLGTGESLVEEDLIEVAGELLERSPDKLVLPTDGVVAPSLQEGERATAVSRDAIPADQMYADIGPQSAETFADEVETARTILWNGPVGVFEREAFAQGTEVVARAVAEATSGGAKSVVGGGDTAAAVAALGLTDRMTHVSTGGGATLEFLAGNELPGIAALTDREWS